VYATYFETGRVTLMKDRSFGLMPRPRLIMVRLDIHFRAELHWRARSKWASRHQVRPDIRDLRSGGIFRRQMRGVGAIGDGADRRGTRKPTPLTEEIIANFQRWLRRGTNGM